jgi:hypothetical protein
MEYRELTSKDGSEVGTDFSLTCEGYSCLITSRESVSSGSHTIFSYSHEKFRSMFHQLQPHFPTAPTLNFTGITEHTIAF